MNWTAILTSKRTLSAVIVLELLLCLLLLYALRSGAEISSGNGSWVSIKPRTDTQRIQNLEAQLNELKANTVRKAQYDDLLAQLEDLRRTTVSFGMLPQSSRLETPEEVFKAVTTLLNQARESIGEVNFSVSVVGKEIASRSIIDTNRSRGPYTDHINYHIQKTFSSLGYYDGPLNGEVNDTVRAVTNFQLANRLRVDGKIGKNTWDAVRSAWEKLQSEK
jgi:hypothetical protein